MGISQKDTSHTSRTQRRRTQTDTAQTGVSGEGAAIQHTQTYKAQSSVKPEMTLDGKPDERAGDIPDEKPNEIDSVLALLKQAQAIGSGLGQLLARELQLALGDMRRLCGLFLLALPLVMLAWLGFAVLIAWVVGDYSQSVPIGLFTFVLLQLAGLLCIQQLWRRYVRSLTLPLTRQHLQSLLAVTPFTATPTGERGSHDSSASDP